MSKNSFQPSWYEGISPKNSYRSIFKWGAKDEFKHPNKRLYELIKKTFNMTDEDFKDRKSTRLNSSHIPLSRMPSSA